MQHNLKILPEYYLELVSGAKTFELRKDNRNYQIGDTVVFSILNSDGIITPSNTIWKITYVIRGGQYGLDKEYCIFSLIPVLPEGGVD